MTDYSLHHRADRNRPCLPHQLYCHHSAPPPASATTTPPPHCLSRHHLTRCWVRDKVQLELIAGDRMGLITRVPERGQERGLTRGRDCSALSGARAEALAERRRERGQERGREHPLNEADLLQRPACRLDEPSIESILTSQWRVYFNQSIGYILTRLSRVYFNQSIGVYFNQAPARWPGQIFFFF